MDDLLFNQADLEYNNDNFEKAFELFLKAAENSDDSAMDRIASMYDAGEGVDYDFDKAIYWYQKAIEAGSVTSLYNLGISYRSKGNVLEAKHWPRRRQSLQRIGSSRQHSPAREQRLHLRLVANAHTQRPRQRL